MRRPFSFQAPCVQAPAFPAQLPQPRFLAEPQLERFASTAPTLRHPTVHHALPHRPRPRQLTADGLSFWLSDRKDPGNDIKLQGSPPPSRTASSARARHQGRAGKRAQGWPGHPAQGHWPSM